MVRSRNTDSVKNVATKISSIVLYGIAPAMGSTFIWLSGTIGKMTPVLAEVITDAINMSQLQFWGGVVGFAITTTISVMLALRSQEKNFERNIAEKEEIRRKRDEEISKQITEVVFHLDTIADKIANLIETDNKAQEKRHKIRDELQKFIAQVEKDKSVLEERLKAIGVRLDSLDKHTETQKEQVLDHQRWIDIQKHDQEKGTPKN